MTLAAMWHRTAAGAYARFAASNDWYPSLARDLVDRADVASASRVVDLCAGTAVVTREVLPHAASRCRIFAIDSSPAMLAEAMAVTKDQRVSWISAAAEECGELGIDNVDVVLCSAALWETRVPAVLGGVHALLRPGGRFVFNLGPAADRDRHETALSGAGFSIDEVEKINYSMTVRQAREWMSLSGSEQSTGLDWPALDPDRVVTAPWHVVTATAQ